MNLKYVIFHIWLFELLLLTSMQATCDIHFGSLKKKDNNISKVMMNIRHCYQKNNNIVLSGNWRNSDILGLNQMFNSSMPLYLIGLHEDFHFKKHKRLKDIYKMDYSVISKKKYPGSNFIIMVYSNNTLQLALGMLKKSILWNHEGLFLIICKNVEDICTTARSLLYLAWSFHILSVALVCYDDDDILQLYTFNPFTHNAPKFWNAVIKNEEEKRIKWTLYKTSLNTLVNVSYSTICENLYFDKTRNLGGYTIQMGAYRHEKLLSYDDRKTGLERFGGVNGDISLVIWSYLNATAAVRFYLKSGFIADNGSLQSFLRDLLMGKIEIAMNMNLLRDFWRLQSYPHETAGFCMVSRKDSFLSTESQFQMVFCPRGWLALGVVCFTLTLTLKYLVNRSLCFAALELLRMIVAAPTRSQPRNCFNKALLVFFVLLMMLLSMYFQSRLTSFVVVPNANPMIETDVDLMKSSLMIYSTLNYNELLSDLNVRERYIFGRYDECVDRLLKGHRAICIAGCYEAKFNAFEGENLHVSKEIRRFYMSFSVGEDWPLYSRFNEVLRRLSEAGFIGLFRQRESSKFLKNLNDTSANYQKLFRKNMKVYWYLWICGIVMAIIVFFADIFFYKMKKRLRVRIL